jgi:hypothetical protein
LPRALPTVRLATGDTADAETLLETRWSHMIA